ncbi:MAG: dTDP-4-dehydrorhamnose 3,5-epimerase, partial [Saprospiraceae bacterium]
MNIRKTKIEDLLILETNVISDLRGYFYRAYSKESMSEIGIMDEFIQTNISYNFSKGTIRGMHMQLSPHSEIKLIRCIKGSVYDVVIDMRKNSVTFLQYFGVELSESNALSMLIPKGFAHGFQTLEDNSIMLYQHSSIYNSNSEFSVSFLEPRINIKWPLD